MKICLLPGDGIGVEIVDAAVEVLDAAAKNSALKLNMTSSLSAAVQSTQPAFLCRKQPLPALRLLTLYCSVLSADRNGIMLLRISVRKKACLVSARLWACTATCAR